MTEMVLISGAAFVFGIVVGAAIVSLVPYL